MMKTRDLSKQAGISIVDVMFAIFVFSVGVLGIAGLQILAKHSNYAAIQRTTAVMLANDIVERIRSNPSQIAAYYGNFEPVPDNAEPTPKCDSSGSPCTPAELAAHDLWEWQQSVLGATDLAGSAKTGGLVEPSACVQKGTNDGDVTIAIVWRSQTATSNPTSTTCGEGTGNYGTNNEFRQVFVFNTTLFTSI